MDKYRLVRGYEHPSGGGYDRGVVKTVDEWARVLELTDEGVTDNSEWFEKVEKVGYNRPNGDMATDLKEFGAQWVMSGKYVSAVAYSQRADLINEFIKKYT